MKKSYEREPAVPLLASLTICTLLMACNSGANEQPGRLEPNAVASGPDKLTWSPPNTSGYATLTISNATASSKGGCQHFLSEKPECIVNLADGKDYVIKLPLVAFKRGLILSGGRNIVLVGGEIWIPMQKNPSIASRTALKVKDATGIVHIEGLLMHGPDISEGIQIAAPKATVQLQNIRIENIHARDQKTFKDNHPDLIQTYGNVALLRVDHFTGSTDYQGFFFKSDLKFSDKTKPPHGKVTLKNVNIVGNPTSRQLLWFQPDSTSTVINNLSEVYLDYLSGSKNSLDLAVYPDRTYSNVSYRPVLSPGGTASWPGIKPRVTGHVDPGHPPRPAGEFVSASSVGVGYKSPGYQ